MIKITFVKQLKIINVKLYIKLFNVLIKNELNYFYKIKIRLITNVKNRLFTNVKNILNTGLVFFVQNLKRVKKQLNLLVAFVVIVVDRKKLGHF